MDAGVYRMSAADYVAMVSGKAKGAGPAKRTNKFGNQKGTTAAGEKYDSAKEMKHHQVLQLAMRAIDPEQRVVRIDRQAKYLLVDKQDGERAINYYADFVVTFANGRVEVQDTKSPPTRADSTYVIKRKLMLAVHGIRIVEI